MKALKIILGIIFFPITVYILIWKSQKMNKKVKIILTAVWTFFVLVAAAPRSSDNSNTIETEEPSVTVAVTTEAVTEPVTEAAEEPTEEPTAEPTEKPSELLYGDLLELKETELDDKTVIVLKAKITPSATNKMTIDKNYMNAFEWLQKHDNKCDEFQYWAVADMQDGSESKVMSFTLNADVINAIRKKTIVDIQLSHYAEDIWILPSLIS